MEKRRFGRTGHLSTVAILGGAAFGKVDQATTDAAMEKVIAAGVNHIDIAPSYGHAEAVVGPWMKRVRDRFFLGCKTMERTADGAAREMQESLERLQVERFDLYQIHAVTNMEEMDAATMKGGALEAIIKARDAGLTDYIGITGHGLESPGVFIEALNRFDFDTVLFPINPRLFADPNYRRDAEALIAMCKARDVGTMIIKSITRGPWGEQEQAYHTWYEPYDEMEGIQRSISFALSQDVTGICTAGDTRILPLVLEACGHFEPLSEDAQENIISEAASLAPLFTY